MKTPSPSLWAAASALFLLIGGAAADPAATPIKKTTALSTDNLSTTSTGINPNGTTENHMRTERVIEVSEQNSDTSSSDLPATAAPTPLLRGRTAHSGSNDASVLTGTVSETPTAAGDSANPFGGAVGTQIGRFTMHFNRHFGAVPDNGDASDSSRTRPPGTPAPAPAPVIPPQIIMALQEADNLLTKRNNNGPAPGSESSATGGSGAASGFGSGSGPGNGAEIAPRMDAVIIYAQENLPPQAAAQFAIDVAQETNNAIGGNAPAASAHVENWMTPIIQANPNNTAALNERAAARHGQGKFKDAAKDATRVLKRKPNDERAYTTRALANYEMQNYAEALEDAKRALALNSNNSIAHQISKLSQGRVTTAEQLGLDSLQSASASKIADEYAAMQRQKNQIEEQLASNPPEPAATGDRVLDSLNQRAQNHIKMGDFQSAVKISNKVLDKEPDNVAALYTRAAAENLMGNYEHAVEDATAALYRDPRHQQALDTRSQALLRLKRFQESIRDADASIALNDKNAYAYMNRAKAKEQIGDIAGMIADYKAAARLSPQFSDELRDIARRYGIPLEAVERELTPVADKEQRKRKGFIFILISSLSGGLLIALGLLHVLSPRRKRSVAVAGAGPDTAQALLGAGLAGYKQLRVIGQGGMGVVYEGLDKALDRKVAIKRMREEIRLAPEQRERFLQEARIVAKLNHPNIVNIHQIVEDGEELYMIFEYVRGSTVDALIANKKRLSVKEAKFILRGVCHALTYAHAKGVIHRDLKPANIMVTDEGMVKVMDFGIARQAADAMAASTHTQTVAGTPQYMAPEQDMGEVRKESDLFALTACFYEMITGSRPFPAPATTASKVNKQYERPSRMAAGLSPEMDAFIDAGLEPDPEKRIRTADEFLHRLDALDSHGKAKT